MIQQNDTVTLILDEARKIIDERGEAGLRVAELAERCNVAVGLLYHYFKDRQALIAEVRAQQFIEIVENDIHRTRDSIVGKNDVASMLEAAMASFGATINDPERKENRWNRMAILTAARHNDTLRQRVIEEQTKASGEIIENIRRTQEMGLVRKDISAEAIALLIESVPLGNVLADVNPEHAPSQEEWMSLINVILMALTPHG